MELRIRRPGCVLIILIVVTVVLILIADHVFEEQLEPPSSPYMRPSNNDVLQDEIIKDNRTGPRFKALWITYIRASYGEDVHSGGTDGFSSTGFAMEAVDFILPLCRLLPDFGWQEEGKKGTRWKEDPIWEEMDPKDKKVMLACYERGKRILKRAYPNQIYMAMIQFSAFDLAKIRHNYPELNEFDYVFSRAMFETNGLPYNWEHHINKHVDEVWVPSHFEKRVFEANGVMKPITVIGEGFDTASLNATENRRSVLCPSCRADDYIFVSVSKYEDRKGFDHLFEAYELEFKKADKVCLALRARGMGDVLKRFESKKILRTCKIEWLSHSQYSSIYSSANAFVLATHGEGWGRTIMEAMAMGLPTLVPLWGGVTEYLNKTVSVPIIVPGLERPPKGWPIDENYDKHHWAKVHVPEIRKAMRWVYEHQALGRAIGRRAREYIWARYTREIVAGDALRRFQEVAVKIQTWKRSHKQEV